MNIRRLFINGCIAFMQATAVFCPTAIIWSEAVAWAKVTDTDLLGHALLIEQPVALAQWKDRIFRLNAFEDFPEVLEGEITEQIAVTDKEGRSHSVLNEGMWKGRHVLIKVSNREPLQTLHEIQMQIFLNKVGLAPEVIGVTKASGQWGIVSEYIPGVHFNLDTLASQIPQHVTVTSRTAKQIRETGLILYRAGITKSCDILQFRITPAGKAILIDVDKLYFDSTAITDPYEDPRSEARAVAKNAAEIASALYCKKRLKRPSKRLGRTP